jgi:hypothetical protein
MSSAAQPPEDPATVEVVGLFADRAAFEAAVTALGAAGFPRADVSVLTSHASLDAAGRPGQSWRDALLALVGEIKYEVPLVASGAVILAGGPVAAALSAVIGAAVGGVAIREVLTEVTAKPHTEEFARAVDAGAIVLWVYGETIRRQQQAAEILEAAGATNIHLVTRPPAPAG